jgi:hypothetical protein
MDPAGEEEILRTQASVLDRPVKLPMRDASRRIGAEREPSASRAPADPDNSISVSGGLAELDWKWAPFSDLEGLNAEGRPSLEEALPRTS